MQYLSQRLAAKPASGRDGEPVRGALPGNQRTRLLDAAEVLVAEKGAAGTTIEAIVKRAGVSTATFYEHFRDKEACLVAAFDRAVTELRAELRGALPEDLSGADRVQLSMAALLSAIDAKPARARLCLVEGQKGGPRMRARYDEELNRVAVELDDPLGEAIVGGIAWLLRERLELGGGRSVQDLLPRMTEAVLAPEPAHG